MAKPARLLRPALVISNDLHFSIIHNRALTIGKKKKSITTAGKSNLELLKLQSLVAKFVNEENIGVKIMQIFYIL